MLCLETASSPRIEAIGGSFRIAIVRTANMPAMTAWNSDWYKADVSEAYFSGSTLEGANFNGANIRGTNFKGPNLNYANLGNGVRTTPP